MSNQNAATAPDGPQHFSYRDIAQQYRLEFRDKYLAEIFPLNEAEVGNEEWEPRQIILHCDRNDNVRGAIVVVDFNGKFFRNGHEVEVLAANTVDVGDSRGTFVATISLNRSLYRQVSGKLETEEHLRERKCVLAHEWLEVMYAICNGHRNQKRSIDGQAELFAIMSTLNLGLPMEDDQEHWDDLQIGLREALVSKGTLEEKLKILEFDNTSDFKREFQAAASERWLRDYADRISHAIKVHPDLTMQRLVELLRE